MTVVIWIDDHTAAVTNLHWSADAPVLRALLQATTAAADYSECRRRDQAAAEDAVLYFQELGFDAGIMTRETTVRQRNTP